MLLKLPKLNVFLSKDKDLNASHPSKFVTVKNGQAMVVANNMICVVDLYRYISTEMEITEAEGLKALETLLHWMEGKSFTEEIWKEMVNPVEAICEKDTIHLIFDTYTKSLSLEENIINEEAKDKRVKEAINILGTPAIGKEKTAIYGRDMALINKAFAKELKDDSLIVDNTASGIKFSFVRRDYIIGFINADVEGSNNIGYPMQLNTLIETFK